MKVLKIAAVSILALGLVLGIALPGLAASDSALPQASNILPEVLRGRVVSIDDDQGLFVIQSGEQELTISVNGDTRYFKLCVPGRIVALAQYLKQWRHQNQEELGASAGHRMGMGHQNQIPQPENVPLSEPQRAKLKWLRFFGEGAEFSDIAVGDRVAVWLAPEENNLAERVLIIKPTTYARVSGTISVSLAGETITITPDGGVAVTLDYNESTVFILNGVIQVEQWQYAHAIYDSDNMIAKRVTVGMPPIELTE
ncbi:hypothetical protein ES703_114953 [subsurface metagenome]